MHSIEEGFEVSLNTSVKLSAVQQPATDKPITLKKITKYNLEKEKEPLSN